LVDRTREVEARAFATADQVWVCSAHDAEVAGARYGRNARLEVVPNAIQLDRYGPPTPSGDHFTVAFTASFSYPPNEVAAQRLMTGIFPPLADRVSRARLALIGRDPTALMQSAPTQDPRIEVTGAVDDVAPYLQRASVMAVPLTEGHGTRFKVLEGFASELPVVSTAKGVEGLDVKAGEHYLAAECDADFVDALELVARDPDLRTRLARRGLEAVRAGYSLAVVHERVTAALASVARPGGRGDYA
jgi:polysaccharide biosynthesis protein PslH